MLARGRLVAVTLHDVPQPAEGADRCRQRTRAYQRIARAAGLVVVSSGHERRLCADAVIAVDAVIPLPVPALPGAGATSTVSPVAPAPPAPGRAVDERSVGVFGFLHPGKAVDLVADAVARLAGAGDDRVTLRLLGEPAEGHHDYVAAALTAVRAAGGRAEVTGRIDDDELAGLLSEVTAPVALFRNVSASGSLNTWAAAGRRPLVNDSEYSREMEQIRPGSILLTDGSDLATDLRRLLDDPAPPAATSRRRAWMCSGGRTYRPGGSGSRERRASPGQPGRGGDNPVLPGPGDARPDPLGTAWPDRARSGGAGADRLSGCGLHART